MADRLSIVGALLRQSLQANSAPADRVASRQDCLDLAAVIAGAKPVALIGCGYRAGSWLDEIAAIAADFGLAIRRGAMPWAVSEEIDALPDWYGTPMLAAWSASEMLTIGQSDLIARFPPDRPEMVDVAEVSNLLGYPRCCVVDHHARRRNYHLLMIELIGAARESEEERRRFASAELLPPLRNMADQLRLVDALRSVQVPFTSLDMCPACESSRPHGPAGRMAETYRMLAQASGLDALFMRTAGLAVSEI